MPNLECWLGREGSQESLQICDFPGGWEDLTTISPCMHGSRTLCQGWSNFDNFFKLMRGRKDQNTTISGTSLACRWCPYIECWLGSFVILRGSRPVLLSYSRGGVRTPCPLLWICPCRGFDHNLRKQSNMVYFYLLVLEREVQMELLAFFVLDWNSTLYKAVN